MENPSDFIQVDINSLPVIEDMVAGNQFIVETPDGTKTINYENVIFKPDNTTFYNEVVNTTTNLTELSSKYTELSATSNNFVNITTAQEFSSAFISTYTAEISSLTTQGQSITSTFNNSYVNDAYIPRTPYGVKAACIFSNTGAIIQNTGNIASVVAAKDSSGTPTGRYIVTLNGIGNNNFNVKLGAAGRPSNVRHIRPVLIDKTSSSLVIQTSGFRYSVNDAGSIYFVIYSN